MKTHKCTFFSRFPF